MHFLISVVQGLSFSERCYTARGAGLCEQEKKEATIMTEEKRREDADNRCSSRHTR